MRLLTRRPKRLTAGQASRSVIAAGDPIGAFGESTTGSGSGSGSGNGSCGRTTPTPFSVASVRFGSLRTVSAPRALVLGTTAAAKVGPHASVGPPVSMVSATATPAASATLAARVAPTRARETGALSAPVAATQPKSMADIYGVFLSDDEDIDGGGGANGSDPLQSTPLPQSRHISALPRRRRRRVGVATPSPIKRPRVVSRDTAAAVSPKEALHGDPDCLVLSVHLISGGQRARVAGAAAATEADVPAVSEDSPSDSEERGTGGVAASTGRVPARLEHRRRASTADPVTGRAWWNPRMPSQGDSVGDEDAFNEVLGSGRAAQETARRRRLRLATPPTAASSAPVGPAGRGEGGGCAARRRQLTGIRPAATSVAVVPNPVRRLCFGEGSDTSDGDDSDALGGGSGGDSSGSGDGDGGNDGGDSGGGGETDTSSGREDWRRAPEAARAAPMRLTFSLLQPTAGGDSSEEGGSPPAAQHLRSPSPPALASVLGGDGATEHSGRLAASAAAGQPSPPSTSVAWLHARLSRDGVSSPSGQACQRGGAPEPALGSATDLSVASSLVRTAAAAVDSPSLPVLSTTPAGTVASRTVVVGTTAAEGERHVLPLPPDQWTWRGRRMTPAERAVVEFLTTGRVRSGGSLPPGIDGAAPIAVTVAAARITLRRRDLRRLRGERWLNDEIMNAYVALLNERNRRRVATAAATTAATAAAAAHATSSGCRRPTPPVPPPLRVYCFNTFFYLRLTQGPDRFDYDGVARWTVKAGVDAATTDLLLVPVHVGTCHWVLVSLDVRSRRVTYLDPLHAADSGGVTSTLSRWLTAEVAARHGGTPTEAAIGVPAAWTVTANTVDGVAAPRQADAGSCGVCVLAMAERLERGAPLAFGQRDIRLLRKQMVLDLYDGKVV
ncbi:hypothetical protein MMPV_004249 [Pyropia vietnamensis]